MKRFFALLLVLALTLSVVGCGKSTGSVSSDSSGETQDLMADISVENISISPDIPAGTAAVTDFGVRLAQNSLKGGENLLISPLSVLSALAMTANGAENTTRTQMEEVFGISIEALNSYLRWYVESLPQGENYSLRLANSIWFSEDTRFVPEREFLQCNADYYGADIYTAPFNESTKDAINRWVADETNGMIDQILDRIPEDALMYLVNALAFEAQWSDMYEDHQVRDGIFTREDGTQQDVEMMHGQEYRYLSDELTTGFIKNYEDRSYAFVALLPREGISMEDYVAALTGERIMALLNNSESMPVLTSMPKFETEYSVELSEVLVGMGMTDAFSWQKADFSALGTSQDGNIHIERVLHKTFISVTQQGTRAGAATVVDLTDGAAILPDKIQEVYLDRPFVYLLIDCENGLPFFIGVLMDAEK